MQFDFSQKTANRLSLYSHRHPINYEAFAVIFMNIG